MSTAPINTVPRSYWFVGASWGEDGDQTSRFLEERIWENGYEDKYLDEVRSMRPGEQIAIKSTYTRKHDLPFDNRGESVSVMAIKAIGTITENRNEGKRVRVDWTEDGSPHEPREWCFYTHRGTVWQVTPGEWKCDALIQFAFEGKPQDIDRFRNAPYWRDRYGSNPANQRFPWTELYQAIADKLLGYQENRSPLIQRIHDIAARVESLSVAEDHFADGSTGPLDDICPFTTFGTFNRGMTDVNRQTVAAEVADFLGVDIPAPDAFPGIPVVDLRKTWFFARAEDRGNDDIDALWKVFAAALRFAHADLPETRAKFMEAYDRALKVRNVAWNLSIALYWVRPWDFVPLDGLSRKYISNELGMRAPTAGGKKPGDGESYLRFLDELKTRLDDESCPVHSFPELSLAAWYIGRGIEPPDEPTHRVNAGTDPVVNKPVIGVGEPYSVANVLEEGCFIRRQEIERMLERLGTRKNLILQGPPGTGKTWLAKRLAFALIGERDERKVRAVQFHPNLSYEDFVRGWRPVGDGKLALADGVFMETLRAASADSSAKFCGGHRGDQPRQSRSDIRRIADAPGGRQAIAP